MSNNLLKGKRGIISGALDENSIAWKTALRVHEEGGKIVRIDDAGEIAVNEADGASDVGDMDGHP